MPQHPVHHLNLKPEPELLVSKNPPIVSIVVPFCGLANDIFRILSGNRQRQTTMETIGNPVTASCLEDMAPPTTFSRPSLIFVARLQVPIGPKIVPFCGSYLEFYQVIPKRNYFGAYG